MPWVPYRRGGLEGRASGVCPQQQETSVNTKFIAGVSRDLRGRQLVAVKGHPEKLEVSRSFAGLFKGM